MYAVPVLWLVGSVLALPPVSVADIVKRLASDDATIREAARADLHRLDPGAIPALEVVSRHPDAEIRTAVAEVLPDLRNRRLVAQTLVTRKVRLRYINATIEDALTDAALQTGIALSLVDLPVDRRWTRMTLDTGEVTPWEALHSLLRAAQLRVEPALFTDPIQPEEEAFRARARFMFGRRGRSILPRIEPTPMRVQDGPEAAGIVRWTQGPLCIEAGPVPGTRVVHPEPHRELDLPLTFQLEPRFAFRGIATIFLDEIRDEHGQNLPAIQRVHDPVLAIDYFTIPRHLEEADRGRWWYRRTLTLPLKTLAKPSHRLESVRGRILMGLLNPAEDLAQVPVVPNRVPEAAPTGDGGQIRVTKADNDGEGTWSLEIILTHPEAGGWTGVGTDTLLERAGNSPLRLVDRNGRVIRLAGGLIDNRNERVCLIKASFVATAEQDGLAQLIYTGRRPIDLEVPFELRGVPLP